jgi:hypothetical protein
MHLYTNLLCLTLEVFEEREKISLLPILERFVFENVVFRFRVNQEKEKAVANTHCILSRL